MPHTIVNGQLLKIPISDIDNLSPAGSISSVNDLSKWVQIQLNNGQANGKQVIPAPVIAETRKPQSIIGDYKQVQ